MKALNRFEAWLHATLCAVFAHHWVETEKEIRRNETHRTVSWSRYCTRCGEYQGPVIRVQRRDKYEGQEGRDVCPL